MYFVVRPVYKICFVSHSSLIAGATIFGLKISHRLLVFVVASWCGGVDDKCFTKERKNEFRLANYNSLGEQKYRLKPQHMSSSSEQKQKFC